MKITYTAPNRSHHYPYAKALNRSGNLHAFVSGFSRFSPRSPIPEIGDKLKRHDFFQNIYLACDKFNAPFSLKVLANKLSNQRLDNASYKWASESDAFIFYRTQGYHTTQRLRKEGSKTICIMEEVNSHIQFADDLMREEFNSLGLGKYKSKFNDYDLRLQAYDECDYILCPSEFVRNSFLSKGFRQEKLIKVNFGFPPIERENNIAPERKKDIFRVLYVGQLNYRKGLRYAIEAFNRIKHPKKEFVIVGPKTEITGIENIKIPDGVVFTGPLKGEALKNQYRLASVFVLPSIEEGLALVQGEALSFGVPLVITTNTGGEDILTNGIEGFIVEPRNAQILAERLQLMADEKELLKNMSIAAFNTSLQLGSWDAAAKRLVSEISAKLTSKGKRTISTTPADVRLVANFS
ncbi:MAG: glycosyltransferase family 4 protein [Chitinophagaceae bacterium]